MDEGMTSSYRYAPLRGEQIRLLKLDDPRHDTKGISCKLEHIDFDDDERIPDYRALSYTWGDPAITVPIRVNGCAMRITTNLAAGLMRLRASPDPSGYLWVDALCINQQDNHEKATQVRRMRSIYSRAQKVIIWLGNEMPTDHETAGPLARIHEWDHGVTHLPYFSPATRAVNESSSDESVLHRTATADSEYRIRPAINAIFARPWFTRIWVIQEFVCACKCTYLLSDMDLARDGHSMTAPMALRKVAFMSALRSGKQNPGRTNAFSNATALTAIKADYSGDGLGSLHEVLALTYGFDATNPLDRVFAVIGLLDEDQMAKYEGLIDYDQTLVELLFKVAKALAVRLDHKAAPGLNLLSHVIKSETRPHGLPSWVPEWRLKDSHYLPLCSVYVHDPAQSAEVLVASDKTLHARGYVIDHIARIVPAPHAASKGKFTSTYEWIMSLRPMLLAAETRKPGQPPPENIKRALVCDSMPPQHGSKGHQSLSKAELDDFDVWFEGHRLYTYRHIRFILWFYCPGSLLSSIVEGLQRVAQIRIEVPTFFRTLACFLVYALLVLSVLSYWALDRLLQFIQRVTGGRARTVWIRVFSPLQSAVDTYVDSNYDILIESMVSGRNQYGTAFVGWSAGRSLCVSSGGSFGWVPDSARVGDGIVVLRSATMAFVMREMSCGRFQVIGDAYVHDLMEGGKIRYAAEREADIVVV